MGDSVYNTLAAFTKFSLKREHKPIYFKGGTNILLYGFFHRESLLCPMCGEVFGFGNDGINGDYRFSDVVYKCVDCGSSVLKYNKLDEVVSCPECGEKESKYKTNFISYHQVFNARA